MKNINVVDKAFMNTVFVLQPNGSPKLRLGDKEYPLHYINTQSNKFDILWEIIDEQDGEVKIHIEYNANLYEQKFMQKLANSYISILSQILNKTELKDISVLTAMERDLILNKFNRTARKLLTQKKVLNAVFDDVVDNNKEK